MIHLREDKTTITSIFRLGPVAGRSSSSSRCGIDVQEKAVLIRKSRKRDVRYG